MFTSVPVSAEARRHAKNPFISKFTSVLVASMTPPTTGIRERATEECMR